MDKEDVVYKWNGILFGHKKEQKGLAWWKWLRIHLPTQGARVWSLVQEDCAFCRVTKPVCHNYWGSALQLASHTRWALELQPLSPCAATTEAPVPRTHALQQEATTIRSLHTAMKSAPLSPKLEKAPEQRWRLSAAEKNKEWNLAICYNVDETWGHMLSEISQRKKNTAWSHLCVEFYLFLHVEF